MKTTLILAVLTVTLLSATAQQNQVIEKGAHHRVVQFTRQIQTPQGVRTETNRVCELQGGLHRWTEQGWAETHPQIEVFQGGAVVRNLQFGLIVAPNLATPNAIDISLPDGGRVQGHLLGLAYTEGNQSALIAEVQDCAGVIGGPQQNELTFADAFTDFSISVKYVVQRDRLSQILRLEQQIPHPSEWGLTENAVLEVLTEFTEFPALRKEANEPVNGLAGERLSFASMDFLSGRAFSIGAEESGVIVQKRMEQFEGQRWFLVEKVPFKAIAPELAGLPPVAKTWRKKDGALMARNRLRLPKREQARAAIKPIQMANATPTEGAKLAAVRKPAYVIDWELGLSTNYHRWRANETWYISGPITVTTNIFEGGVVIKYAPTNNAKLTINGPVTCESDRYRPIVFTARDDHTIGGTIGSASLSGYFPGPALDIDGNSSGAPFTFKHLRISHANLAINIYGGGSGGHLFSHAQLIHCAGGVTSYYSPSFFLRNVLGHELSTTFTGNSGYTTGHLEHVTIHSSGNFNASGACGLRMTNCLLIATTNTGSFVGSNNETNLSDTGIFETVGGGSHYLATGSAYRNAGTTNINPTLLEARRKLTTHPPLVLSNTITLDTTLRPYAQRDTDIPDLGYAYDPIDYALGSCVITNATLTLTNGVAIATFGVAGVAIYNNGHIVSHGKPERRNQICRYNTVQEQSTNWGTASGSGNYQIYGYQWATTAPRGQFRFTDFSEYAGGGYHIYTDDSQFIFDSLLLRDCDFNAGSVVIAGSEGSRIGVTNNLFQCVGATFLYYPSLDAYNNLFKGSACHFEPYGSTNTWTIKDNSFDNTTIYQEGSLVNSNNAYINCATRLTPNAANDIVTNNFTYHVGPLGKYYQPTNSALVDKGSITNAALAGLYHHTTATNALKEATSRVDIGLHYVAANYAAGTPEDYDSDFFFADWFEDINGNGSYDPGAGESDWQTYNSKYGVGSGPGLQVFTPLRP
jgi:hypothetical protein